MPAPVLRHASASGLLLALVLNAPLAAAEAGPSARAVDGLWFLDAARDRNLGVQCWLPDPLPERLPVVVFSHGLGGSQWGYGYLGQAWAAAGICVVIPSHPGTDYRLIDGFGPFDRLANLKAAARDIPAIAARPGDISFLLRRLDLLEQKVPALAGRLDHAAIGVAGHSMGAWTVMALAGLELPGPALADPLPRAFIALSPQGRGRDVPDSANPWHAITRPLLMMTGSADETPAWLGGAGDPAWRMQAWAGLPPGGKLLLWLEGAEHTTFSNGAGGRGFVPDPAHIAAITQTTTLFWQAHLLGRADALDGIKPIASALPGARLESK